MEPRKCWIMARQSWDNYCSSLLPVNAVPRRRAREIGGALVCGDTSELADQACTSSDLEAVSPRGVQAIAPNL